MLTLQDQKSTPGDHYPVLFDPSKQAVSIKTFAFPIVKRQPAEKCEGQNPWLQKGSNAPYLIFGETLAAGEQPDALSSARLDWYSSPQGIVALNAEGIELAVERRVALFFQQTILCYKMSCFTFSTRGADSQIGSSSAITLSAVNGKLIEHKREAAHSSTIPTLIAHAKDGSTPQGFVYLKGGSSYAQHNATIGMHVCINGADELIDGKGNDGKLRAQAVAILNLTAEGLDPIAATKRFLGAFENQVLTEYHKLPAQDNRKFVLEKYYHKIKEIQLAAEDKRVFDRLIGVIIHENDPHEKKLREVIYQKRFDMIRQQEVVESRIGKRLETARQQVTSGAHLETMLLKEFTESDDKKTLEKLLAKTAAIFDAKYGKKIDQKTQQEVVWLDAKQVTAHKSYKTRVINLLPANKANLYSLMQDLRVDFRALSMNEFTYRAGVFRGLRVDVYDWTQKKFKEQYLAKTGESISQSWVSRMEQPARLNTKRPEEYQTPLNQRRKYVTLDLARKCASTFGVDAGLFLPGLFTSR